MNLPMIKEESKLQQKQITRQKIFFCIILIMLVSIGLATAFLGRREGNYQLFTLMLIGLGASFIGTLAGGGGLITVPGMMLTGIPIQTSIATNKFSSGIAALSSVFYLIRNKQLSVHFLLITILIAVLGGIGGALVTTNIQEETMNIIAFALLCFALIVTIKNKQWTATIQQDKKQKQQKTTKKRLYIPFLIAAYDGGFESGSATFSILFYLKSNFTYIKAVQMTRVIILGSCTGGFIIYYQNGFINWYYAICMAVGSIIGSQIGLLVLPKVSQKAAKTLLVVIISALMLQMIVKII